MIYYSQVSKKSNMHLSNFVVSSDDCWHTAHGVVSLCEILDGIRLLWGSLAAVITVLRITQVFRPAKPAGLELRCERGMENALEFQRVKENLPWSSRK
jgi:hypothetical protein